MQINSAFHMKTATVVKTSQIAVLLWPKKQQAQINYCAVSTTLGQCE
jgi:hypothetical protein